VKQVHAGEALKTNDLIVESAVHAKTWTRILHAIG
jgi:hypothetical protein